MKQKLSITLWVVLTLITFFPRGLKACTGISFIRAIRSLCA